MLDSLAADAVSMAGRMLAAAGQTGPAGTPDPGIGLQRALMWALLLLVVGVVAIWLAFWFRRQMLGSPRRNAPEAAGFSLTDLRRLRAEGKITKEEYEQTRDRIVQAAQRAISDASDDDRPPVDAPRTKDVDLIRDAER